MRPTLQSAHHKGYTRPLFGQLEESSVESPELSRDVLLAAGAIVAIIGLLLGYLWGRRTSTAAKKYREVERKLDQVLQDKKLLNNLTENYRDVHNHLAKGADTLCQGQGPVSLERSENNLSRAEIPADLAGIQPPLDYAPKTSPSEKGMLNEEFGLERQPTPLPEEAEKA